MKPLISVFFKFLVICTRIKFNVCCQISGTVPFKRQHGFCWLKNQCLLFKTCRNVQICVLKLSYQILIFGLNHLVSLKTCFCVHSAIIFLNWCLCFDWYFYFILL